MSHLEPAFIAGKNIAIKVPPHEFSQTIVFYRDILKFAEVKSLSVNNAESVVFEFGDKNLWIDRTVGVSQAEIWLEIITENIDSAADYFENNNCVRRDDIEPLPGGVKAFWLTSPANIIHLINENNE